MHLGAQRAIIEKKGVTKMERDPRKRPALTRCPRPFDDDRVTAEDEDEDEPDYEPTYRDGSAKNECWRDQD